MSTVLYILSREYLSVTLKKEKKTLKTTEFTDLSYSVAVIWLGEIKSVGKVLEFSLLAQFCYSW